MPDLPKHLPQTVIVFCFRGGLLDGQIIRSDEPQAAKETQAFWELTWKGTVGRRFDAQAPNAPTYQRYQVKSKQEAAGEIHVTCEPVVQ